MRNKFATKKRVKSRPKPLYFTIKSAYFLWLTYRYVASYIVCMISGIIYCNIIV